MAADFPRGITLLDLVRQVPGAAHGLIPERVAAFLEMLSVTSLSSRVSPSMYVVEGVSRSAVELGLEVADRFSAELPGVTSGVRFEYAARRAAATAGANLEAAPVSWQLNLYVGRVLVPVPGLQAAVRGATTDGWVGPLFADEQTERVHIWLKGVVAIVGDGSGVNVRLAAEPDPFVPDAPTGTVLEGGMEPRHALFGANGFGMTAGEIVWDSSTVFTPDEITSRGHDAAWQGLSVSDATLYLPRDLPFVGDVTFGVRDLLVGRAPSGGVQLEALLQLGEPSLLDTEDEAHKVSLYFYQDIEGQVAELVTPSGPALVRNVEVQTAPAGTAPIRVLARLFPPEAQGRWKIPGRTAWTTANETGWFVVRPGDPHHTLGYRDIVVIEGGDGETADGPQITFAFVDGAAAQDFPPTISLTLGSSTWENVTHVSGSAEQLAGARFQAVAAPSPPDDLDRVAWELALDTSTIAARGASFEPSAAWPAGVHVLTLSDPDERRRRLEIEVLPASDRLVVGCALVAGAASEDERRGPRQLVGSTEGPAAPAAVLGSYHLRAFHQDGERRSSDDPATLAPLVVPAGTLAEVSLLDPDELEEHHVLSAVRLLMDFDATLPRVFRQIHPEPYVTSEPGYEGTHVDPWGPPDPYPVFTDGGAGIGTGDQLRPLTPGADANASAAAVLRGWAREVLAADPAAQFVVIGRACDLGPEIDPDGYNTALGGRRAAQGRALLTDPAYGPEPLDASIVCSRGENEDESLAVGTMPDDPTILPDLSDPELNDRSLAARAARQLRIKVDYPGPPIEWGAIASIPEREEARSIDVYAVVPAPWLSGLEDDDAARAGRRRTLVPGSDQWSSVTESPRERDLGVAAQLLAKWDSPTWVDAQDSVPTLVQLTLDWENRAVDVPFLGGQVQADATSGPEFDESKVWQLVLRFSKDPRTRQMVLSGALDTPGSDEGIFTIADAEGESGIASTLAVILGLGPALTTGVADMGLAGSAVPLAALAGVAALATLTDVVRNGSVTVHRVELEYSTPTGSLETFAEARVRLLADYSVTFDVEVPNLVSGAGVAIRYRRAGLEYDNSSGSVGLNKLDILYEEAAEIVTPGTWEMPAPIARLLAVTAIRMGAGSVWFEVDIALARDLGPVELRKATIRVTTGDGVTIELRGLEVAVDIPGVVYGEGQLAIASEADGLRVSAAIDLDLIPAGIRAAAAFVYAEPMVQLEVDVRFAAPIPLLNTGLGLFGLSGRFVSNGTRALDAGIADPVQRELAWYETAVTSKYAPLQGQTALGIGAVVGTMPEAGFTMNLDGMLAVELPDPSVVLTVAGVFMDVPDQVTEKADSGSATTAGLLGIVAVGPEGLAVAIRGSYSIPGVIDVQVPVAAWFPFQSDGLAAYVRIGSDGFGAENETPRPNQPVTVTILPGILDVRGWAYLMIEEKALPNLGGRGDEGFDFTGFSLGFGTGFTFVWGGNVASLSAAASILVGLGTNPFLLKGAFSAEGELSLGPATVSVTTEIVGTILRKLGDLEWQLTGEATGELDLGLVKISETVKITLGSAPALPSPAEHPLVSGVLLTDARCRVVAEARDVAAGGVTGDAHTAWVDCRPVVHFNHRILDALEETSFTPTPSGGWGADWSGTSDLKYLFRLRAVELLDDTGAVVPGASDWPSTWWMPSSRAPLPVEGEAPASEHEGWDLALLAWDPAPWARALTNGGEDTVADPAVAVERLCDPLPTASTHCLLGANGRRVEADRVRFAERPAGPLPWPSVVVLEGTETVGPPLDDVLAWSTSAGYAYQPGRRVPMPEPWIDPLGGDARTHAWLLPRFTHAEQTPVTAGFDAVYVPEVVDPELVLAVGIALPVSGSEAEVCYTFEEDEVGQPLPLPLSDGYDYGLITFSGADEIIEAGLGGAVMFDRQLEIEFREAIVGFGQYTLTRAEAWVRYDGNTPIGMCAFDADGVLVDQARVPAIAGQGVLYRLVVNAPAIARLELEGDPAGQTNFLERICLQVTAEFDPSGYIEAATDLLEDYGDQLAPAVAGLRAADERVWTPEVIDVVSSTRHVAAIVRYRPDAADAGPWRGIRIDPVSTVEVGIVSSCVTSETAESAASATDAARIEILDAWNSAWDGAEDERVVLLDADRTWSVRIRYDRAVWERAGVAGAPAASALDWENAPDTVSIDTNVEQTFEFKTAATGTLADDEVLQFDEQQRFDPRALARYIIGYDPERSRPLHFLGDALLVHFSVEWVETLLERHGHDLVIEVVRTDPLPGTPVENRTLFTAATWSSSTSTMNATPADARLALAALLAPCVEGPLPQGTTASVVAPLEPRAEYDLVVVARPPGANPADVVVGRSHFRTSAYRDVDELLTALGFASTSDTPNPAYPVEAIAPAAAPTDVLLADDQALDAALATLGMDPWPLPTRPETVVVWIDDGGWKVAAVLLDSDEELERPARLEDVFQDGPTGLPQVTAYSPLGPDLVAVVPETGGAPIEYVEAPQRLSVTSGTIGGTVLKPRRSNASGTRVLLVPAVPVSVPAGDSVLTLSVRDRHRTIGGHRFITRVPHVLSQEWS